GRVGPGADDHGAQLRGVRAAADLLPQRAAPHRQAGDPRGDSHRPGQRSSHHDQAERTELSRVDAPTRTDPPYVPIRTNRWAPHQKAPRWLLLAGALIVVGAVLVALVHKPTHTQQAGDLKGFLTDMRTDIQSCAGGVHESL